MNIETTGGTPENPELALSGRFDAFETERFRLVVDELLASDATSISLDLAEVHFIDSSGLAELVRAMKHCRESDGDLFLLRPSDPVAVILELTRLDAAFEIRQGAAQSS